MNIHKTIVDQLKQVIDPIIAIVSEVRKDFENYKKELPETIKSDPEFIEVLRGHKGEKGDPGEKGKPGESGKDAVISGTDKINIANLVKSDEKFKALVKGEKGDPGIDGKDAVFNPDLVAESIKSDADFICLIKGDPGEKGVPGSNGAPGVDGRNGKDAVFDVAKVADVIVNNPDFIVLAKGSQGEKGDTGEKGDVGEPGQAGKDAEFDPELVANVIKKDPKFLMLSKGEKGDTGAPGEKGEKGIDGKDAVYDALSTIVSLKLDKEFVQIIKGDPGEKGEKGQNGKDGSNGIDGKNGKDAREVKPIEVADVVLSDKDFIERTTVKDGKDGLGIYTKTWTPGVYRQDEYVQHYMGQHFRSLVDTGEEPGIAKEWERVGTSGWRFRGFYKSDMPLEEGDLVTKDYGVFIFTSGELKLFIGRGAQGLKGDQGQKGEKGIDGINGRDGETIEVFEVGGTTIALVTTDADGNKHTHSVDLSVMFEPILKKVSAIHKSVQTVAKANELDYMSVKADIKQELLGHETEESAVPIRFFRGDWSSNSTYYPGDLVEFGNGLALCTAQTTGEVPDSMFSNSEVWEMLGGKGSGGDGTVSLAQDTSIQEVSFSAASSPVDLSKGTIVNIGTITGNLLVPTPINPMQGKEYTFILPIDAVGGRTVTFPDGVALTGLLANRIYSVKFMYVGTDFIKISSTA